MRQKELFGKKAQNGMPLAARMRPGTLDDIVGQEHLLGQDGVLSRLLAKRALSSMILWGPPGSGKTTLAENLCRVVEGEMIKLSAVHSGVKEIREAIQSAHEKKNQSALQTYLFIDEIHRFNRAQQDALLPHVEEGTITLFGATTENPSFSVNTPLLSRCRVVVLRPLQQEHLQALISRALLDEEKGLGLRRLRIDGAGADKLILAAGGDARILLSILEVAADLVQGDESVIDAKQIEMAVGRRLIAHDRAGDGHYNVISAFIKSMRGSDPDAACYYLARMLEAGEDPRFLLRRMIIFASEDVGNADPQAIQVATSALQAFELVGLPEGYLPLTQAATYLACAPKSNAVITAYNNAKEDVNTHGALPVPLHICNAPTQMMKSLGYGKDDGNEYYLPEKLSGKKYYVPTRNGYERFIVERLEKIRNKVT